MINHEIALDMCKRPGRVRPRLTMRRGESQTQKVTATLTENGAPYTPTYQSARLCVLHGDGTWARCSATVGTACVTATLTSEALNGAGRCRLAYFEFYSSNGYSETTENIELVILENVDVNGGDAAESYDDELDALYAKWSAYEKTAEQQESARVEAEAARVQAEAGRVEAETSRDEAWVTAIGKADEATGKAEEATGKAEEALAKIDASVTKAYDASAKAEAAVADVDRAVASIPSDYQSAIKQMWRLQSTSDADYLASGDDLNDIAAACSKFSESSDVTSGISNKPSTVTGPFLLHTFSTEREPSRLGQMLMSPDSSGTALFTRSGAGADWTEWAEVGSGGEGVDQTARDAAEAASEAAEYNRQSLIGEYEGRNLELIVPYDSASESVFDGLHRLVANGDFSDLRVGDYMNVELQSSSGVTAESSLTFAIAHFDPYYCRAQSADTIHHIAFVASRPITVSTHFSGATSSGFLLWGRSASNQGASDDACPYTCSRLKTWETALEECLPEELIQYLLTRNALLECRYSASGAITDSDSQEWKDIGKVWSLSETEVHGQCVWGTKGYSVGSDRQFDYFRNPDLSGDRHCWWLRTVASGSTSEVCVCEHGGVAEKESARYNIVLPRVAFLFR